MAYVSRIKMLNYTTVTTTSADYIFVFTNLDKTINGDLENVGELKKAGLMRIIPE